MLPGTKKLSKIFSIYRYLLTVIFLQIAATDSVHSKIMCRFYCSTIMALWLCSPRRRGSRDFLYSETVQGAAAWGRGAGDRKCQPGWRGREGLTGWYIPTAVSKAGDGYWGWTPSLPFTIIIHVFMSKARISIKVFSQTSDICFDA